ncbi:MAG TPA: MarR family transcriptional regulator [Anaeromyxobacteraceae bacterium]|nr:MarR family transcriptional regulator [Anaeromyxobacteraceae bacterium]
MQQYPGLLIAAARHRIKQVVLAQVAQHRLTSQQFWMLIALRESPGLSQAELAARVRADAPTVSRTVSGLLERGLLRSEPDPDDRRRSRMYLSARGERLARELAPVARDVRAALVDGMDEREVAALREGLQRVIANLDRYQARVRRKDSP